MNNVCNDMADIVLSDIMFIKEYGDAEHERKWNNFIKIHEPYEVRLHVKMQNLFRLQRDIVLANLYKSEKAITKDATDNWLYDSEEWTVRFAFETEPELRDALITQGYDAHGTIGIDVEVGFDIDAPEIDEWLNKNVQKYVDEIDETTIKALRTTLLAGLNESETIDELAKRVRLIYVNATKNRALAIARTEVTGASNFGIQEAYRQSNVVWGSEWLTAIDGRERESHARMNGTITKLHTQFGNGLLYPGDPSGKIEEIIMCRCSTTAVTINDSRVPKDDRK